MTDKHNEHLSALIDGEDVDGNVLDRILSSDTDKATFQRYRLSGSIMREDIKSGMAMDISLSVAAHIAAEPAHSADSSQRVVALDAVRQRHKPTPAETTVEHSQSRWWRPAASFAVAASVALVTVIGVQNYQVGADGQPIQATDTSLLSPSSPVFETQPFSGFGSPVSYNATQEAPLNVPGNIDQRRHIQSFFIDHQQQTQLSLQDEAKLADPSLQNNEPGGGEPDNQR